MQVNSPDPAAVLCSPHRQIERALASLMRIAKQSGDGPLCDAPAFSKALRFFRVIAPEHSAAEEEIVFPRLRREMFPGNNKDVLQLMDALEEEHGCADRAHEEANRLGELWLANGALSPAQTSRLLAALEGLDALYSRHIQLEETEVFPRLSAILAPSDSASLRAELARRHLTAVYSAAL